MSADACNWALQDSRGQAVACIKLSVIGAAWCRPLLIAAGPLQTPACTAPVCALLVCDWLQAMYVMLGLETITRNWGPTHLDQSVIAAPACAGLVLVQGPAMFVGHCRNRK